MATKKGSKKHPVCKQNDIWKKAVTKSESRQIHNPWKFISWKLQILAIFGYPQNIIPLKIPLDYGMLYSMYTYTNIYYYLVITSLACKLQ